MTTRAPRMGSQILMPSGEDLKDIKKAIADRDSELVERIEELDDHIDLLKLTTGFNHNRLVNPGFEIVGTDGFDTWVETTGIAGGIYDDKSDPHSGQHCAKVVNGIGATVTSLLDQYFVPDGSGVTYSLQFWSKGDGSNAPTYRVFQSSTNLIATTSVGSVTGTWYLTSASFTTISTNAVLVRLAVPGVANATAYFDDVLVMPAVSYAGVDTYIGQIMRVLSQMLGDW